MIYFGFSFTKKEVVSTTTALSGIKTTTTTTTSKRNVEEKLGRVCERKHVGNSN